MEVIFNLKEKKKKKNGREEEKREKWFDKIFMYLHIVVNFKQNNLTIALKN